MKRSSKELKTHNFLITTNLIFVYVSCPDLFWQIARDKQLLTALIKIFTRECIGTRQLPTKSSNKLNTLRTGKKTLRGSIQALAVILARQSFCRWWLLLFDIQVQITALNNSFRARIQN